MHPHAAGIGSATIVQYIPGIILGLALIVINDAVVKCANTCAATVGCDITCERAVIQNRSANVTAVSSATIPRDIAGQNAVVEQATLGSTTIAVISYGRVVADCTVVQLC